MDGQSVTDRLLSRCIQERQRLEVENLALRTELDGIRGEDALLKLDYLRLSRELEDAKRKMDAAAAK